MSRAVDEVRSRSSVFRAVNVADTDERMSRECGSSESCRLMREKLSGVEAEMRRRTTEW